MNIEWADKNKISEVEFIAHVTTLICFIMKQLGFTEEQVRRSFENIVDEYTQFYSKKHDDKE
jgi:hypothetical protein